MELIPDRGTSRDNVACVESVGTPFEMREHEDLDGAVRLVLSGALDIVVVDRLTARLRARVAERGLVRVDLSELGFIDCTGLRTIASECERARARGRRIEIDRPVSAPVKRVITFLSAESRLWPSAAGRSLRVVGGTSPDASPQRAEVNASQSHEQAARGGAPGQAFRGRLRTALDAARSRRRSESG